MRRVELAAASAEIPWELLLLMQLMPSEGCLLMIEIVNCARDAEGSDGQALAATCVQAVRTRGSCHRFPLFLQLSQPLVPAGLCHAASSARRRCTPISGELHNHLKGESSDSSLAPSSVWYRLHYFPWQTACRHRAQRPTAACSCQRRLNLLRSLLQVCETYGSGITGGRFYGAGHLGEWPRFGRDLS